MGLIDGTVHHPDRDPDGRAAALNGGQRPFRLQHEADSAELTFGTQALSLILDEQALAKLAGITTQALTRLQAIPKASKSTSAFR